MTEDVPAATLRLDYTSATQRAFDGTVIALRPPGANGRPAVALDRSIFYPTSGGQPHDTGTLGGAGTPEEVQVVDVTVEQGVVWHWLAQAPPWQPGERVAGAIDWARRFDHMQQHSAQHLLSQVFARLFAAETLSVHFGSDESTLDVDVAALDAAQLAAAEALAAETVFAALPIRAYEVDESELASLPLRKPPKVQGRIRIVEIEGFDWSACGGTHCATTAQCGPIKILRSERRRGGVRLSFVAGGRAVADYAHKHALLNQAAGLFSSDAAQLPALIERQLAQSKELARRLDETLARLLAYDAAQLLADAPTLAGEGSPRLVCAQRDDLDAAGLRKLANLLLEQAPQPPGLYVLLAGAAEGTLQLAFARSASLPQHMGNLLREALQRAGGSGGGRPDFAQGGGLPASEADALLAFVRARLQSTE